MNKTIDADAMSISDSYLISEFTAEDTSADFTVEDSPADCTAEESTEESELSSSEDADVDLEELYESFDYENSSQASTDAAPSSCGHEIAETALYSGAQLTVFQSHLLIFQYAVRHSLSVKAFTELLKLLSVHAPQGATIPKSVHNIKRYFLHAFPDASPVQHAYCSLCQRSLPSVDSRCEGRGCQGGDSAVYITIPVGPQIKRKMEGRQVTTC